MIDFSTYFHKRAPVIACHILTDHSKSAVMEFNDRTAVEKILQTRYVSFEEANLSLSQATRHLTSFFSLPDHGIEYGKTNIKLSPTERIPSPIQFVSTDRYLSPFIISSPPPCLTSASGWSSPPRSVLIENSPIDRPASQMSSNDSASTNGNHIDIDIKPPQENSSKSDLLKFAEEMEMELEKLRNEYRVKFQHDQVKIAKEIDSLIKEEQQTLENLNCYLSDRRRPHSDYRKRTTHYKRKYSPS